MPTPQRINDLVRAYADGARLIEAALEGVSEKERGFKPGPEHWSIHENVIHLAEIDLIVAARIRFVVAMPGAPLLATDADRWGQAFDYTAFSLAGALGLMRAVRASTADLLAHAPAEAWENVGVHSKAGPVTLEWIVGHMVEHVHAHLKSIAKRRQQYAEAHCGEVHRTTPSR